MYQNDEKMKKLLIILNIPARLMAWVGVAANGTASLIFIDDVTADKGRRMSS